LITKNETENLMDEAIGSQISDYLIKPVNPNQVWLSLKKIIDNKRLVAEKTTTAYQQQFAIFLWHSTAIPITMNGWIFIKNWCIGNWKCKK
jgi:YesN/AraC family two-component response regulator